MIDCSSCAGTVKLKIFACAIHGECTPLMKIEGIACCNNCPDRVTTTTVEMARTPTDKRDDPLYWIAETGFANSPK